MAIGAPAAAATLLLLILLRSNFIEAYRRHDTALCIRYGQILHGDDWRSYRKCVYINGALEPQTYQCKKNEYFDPTLGCCSRIPGGGRTVDQKSKKKTEKIILIADPDNSKRYIAHTPAGTILMECGSNYKFSEKHLRCRKIKKKVYKTPKLPECVAPGKFPIEGSNRLYYSCTPGRKYGEFEQTVHACPEGSTFCAKRSVCVGDKPDKNVAPEDRLEALREDHYVYPPCTEVGWFRVPSDCSRYYSCKEHPSGRLHQSRYVCPDGQAYCVEEQVCLPKELVPGCHLPLLSGLDLYPCYKPGKVPLPDLTGFYTCIPVPKGGYKREFTHCEEGYIYCHTKQKCVPANPDSPENKTSCTGPGWFADEKNCGFYFHCVPNNCGGYSQTFYQCPKGEGFDATLGKCTPQALKECLYPLDAYMSGKFFECREQGTFATYDCTGFCTCTRDVDGSWNKQCTKCPDEERYSEELGICTTPDKSNCVPIKDRQYSFDCKSVGIFGVPYDDKLYVICTKNINGTFQATKHHCPCGTFFSPSFGFCVDTQYITAVEGETMKPLVLTIDEPCIRETTTASPIDSATTIVSDTDLILAGAGNL